MKKENKSQTLLKYEKYKRGKYYLYGGTFLCPVIPTVIVTGINWDEWFNKSGSSLPLGFATMLLTVILAIIGILKSGTIFKKTDIALYFLSGLFLCVGITNLFLSSLFSQVGYLWLYTGAGLFGSACCILAEKKLVEPKIEEYKKLVEDNGLDLKSREKAERKKLAEEEARKLAEEEASKQQPTE